LKNPGIRDFRDPKVNWYEPSPFWRQGKENKKFEFCSKTSILVDQQTGIIMGALNFTETLHDIKTLPGGVGTI
jgi:hypothetical protein